MDHIQGQDRNKIVMTSLDQWMHRESFARIIDAFVNALDLSTLGFKYIGLNKEGRPLFHPGVLMKLYLYSYQYEIRSCQKLKYASEVNVEVMWLLKGLHPHYKTIANFRKDYSLAFRKVFRHFVAVMKDWKLVDHLTIDRSKRFVFLELIMR